jgi:hypothetical protein
MVAVSEGTEEGSKEMNMKYNDAELLKLVKNRDNISELVMPNGEKLVDCTFDEINEVLAAIKNWLELMRLVQPSNSWTQRNTDSS